MKQKILLIVLTLTPSALAWYWWNTEPPETTKATNQAAFPKEIYSATKTVDVTTADTLQAPITTAPDKSSLIGLASFQALLEASSFERAVELYDRIYTASTELTSNQYRRVLLDYASALIESQQLSSGTELLTTYTDLYYRDVDALVTLGQAHYKGEDYNAAISALQEAHLYSHLFTVQAQIQRLLDESINMLRRELASENKLEELVDLFRTLSESQPDHAPYHLGLANAYIASRNYEQALKALNYVEHDVVLGLRAKELIAEIEDGSLTNEVTVPLQSIGNSFLVEATVNDRLQVTLILDTGASISVIKPTVLANLIMLNANSDRVTTLNTANGAVTAPLVQLESLSISGNAVRGVTVASIDLTGLPNIDGLLGMDYLRHFGFTVDRDQKALILTK